MLIQIQINWTDIVLSVDNFAFWTIGAMIALI